ncbi:MAG: tetratricopeptide repeat protein [Formivibrio sp.]|nr:tetratricopeptide repeat protein [Formivibrio sp.]
MLLRSSTLLLFSVLLGGCVTQQSQPIPVVAAAEQPEGDAAPRDEGWRSEDLPNVDLSADLMFRILAGDIAAQREQPGLAAKSWLDLARRTHDPRIARRALELSLNIGQPQLAQEAAQIWVETAPQSLLAKQILISLLIRANRLKEVEPYIPAFLKAPQRELAAFYLQLHLLWTPKADPVQVARLTGLLTAGQDKMPEARFARAVMHAGQAQDAAAIAELDAALKLRPWWEQAVLYKAQLLAQRTPPDAAFDYLREAISKNPMQQVYSLTLARMLNEASRPAEARAVYEAILAQHPEQVEAQVGVGLLALQSRDFDVAYQMFFSALNHGAGNGNLLRYYLGQIDEERHRPSEALAWYRQVEGDENRAALERIPRVLARMGERDAAIKALADVPAVTEAEKIQKIQIEGQVWRELKEPLHGYEVLTKGIAQFPDAVDLYYDRSLIADLLHKQAEGEADLRHVLQMQPDNVMALNALGYVLANRTDRLAEAETLLTQALAAEPDNAVIIDSMGWLRFHQGRLKEAVDLLGKAYGKMPDPEIAAHYAEALWKSGEQAKARSVLDAALKLDPTHDVLLETRKRLGL